MTLPGFFQHLLHISLRRQAFSARRPEQLTIKRFQMSDLDQLKLDSRDSILIPGLFFRAEIYELGWWQRGS
jgi:hypothetical protein